MKNENITPVQAMKTIVGLSNMDDIAQAIHETLNDIANGHGTSVEADFLRGLIVVLAYSAGWNAQAEQLDTMGPEGYQDIFETIMLDEESK